MAAGVQPQLSVGEQFKNNTPGRFRLTLAYSYSDTDKYYVGENRDRVTETNVKPSTLANEVTGMLEYDVDERLSVLAEIPFLYVRQVRDGPASNAVNGAMTAVGLGDVRLMARYWITEANPTINVYAAAGIRLPTGKGDEKFTSDGGNRITKDFAAQTGTGNGAGIVEVGGYGSVTETVKHFFQARYVFTPASHTEGNNFRFELSGNGERRNSDSDAMSFRVGLSVPVQRFAFTGSISGAWVPYDDLFGATSGFRRAGVILFAEPGVTWSPRDTVTLNASLPITFYRKLQQNGGNLPDTIFQMSMTFSF